MATSEPGQENFHDLPLLEQAKWYQARAYELEREAEELLSRARHARYIAGALAGRASGGIAR